jgi:enoyl-CoA hydratase
MGAEPGSDDSGALVRVELVDNGVAQLTLDDPDHRNALSLEMTLGLAAAVDEALASDVGAIILTATPPVFCAGGSLDDLLAPRAGLREMYAGFLALANAPVLTIAAVNGPAIGAGVNLPLACDIILATPEARFDPRFLDVGIHPGGGHLHRLAQRIGRQGAAALVLTGEALDGAEAEREGLAWRCVPSGELRDVALGLARRAAGRPRALVARTKATLDATIGLADAGAALEIELEAQEWSMAQPEFHERVQAIKARIDRRPPS